MVRLRLLPLAALLLLPPSILHATTFTVTTTADDVAVNGNCTLREAVIAANTNAAVDACPAGTAADVIVLAPGEYRLSVAGPGEDYARSGDLDILDDITIRGASAALTTIHGGWVAASPLADRVVHVTSWGTLMLSGIAISGGWCASGAGILNDGELYLLDSRVSGNVASESADGCPGFVMPGGAGILNAWSAWLGITRSEVSGNEVLGNTGADDVSAPGGGLMNLGTASIAQSHFAANRSAIGGALWNLGGLDVLDTEITGNAARFQAAGLMNYEDATLARVTVSDNYGGGVVSGSSYGTALLRVYDSTFSGNVGYGEGGGLLNYAGAVYVKGSTIVGNLSQYGGSGVSGYGATSLVSTIVAHNGGRDCDAAVVSLGNNLDGDGTCGLNAAGDLARRDPRLGALADNGGPTRTHALLPDSPAIDHIPNTACLSAIDQRTVARNARIGPCDIGAYEFSPFGDIRLIVADIKNLARAGAITLDQQRTFIEALKVAELAAMNDDAATACPALAAYAAIVAEAAGTGAISPAVAAQLAAGAERAQALLCR